jgi:hypothetical protein
MNAGALLASNVTQVLKKEGVIRAVRADTEKHNPFAITSVDGFIPQQIAQLALETGMYTYLLPGNERQYYTWVELVLNSSDFVPGYEDFTQTQPVRLPLPVLHLPTMGFANVALVTDSGTSDPTSLALQWDMHLEFTADSQLFSSGVSVLTLEDLRSATTALQSAGVFYENPTHFAALAAVVSKAVSFAWPLLAPAARAAALAGAQSLVQNIGSRMTSYMNQRFQR